MGKDSYASVLVAQAFAASKTQIVPQILIQGQSGKGGSMVEALLGAEFLKKNMGTGSETPAAAKPADDSAKKEPETAAPKDDDKSKKPGKGERPESGETEDDKGGDRS
jgi:hypothetical protein